MNELENLLENKKTLERLADTITKSLSKEELVIALFGKDNAPKIAELLGVTTSKVKQVYEKIQEKLFVKYVLTVYKTI